MLNSYRVVTAGMVEPGRTQAAAAALATRLSATPQQLAGILAAPHYVLAKNLDLATAERYAAMLRDQGVTVRLEDEAALLAIELPKAGDLVPVDEGASVLDRLVSYGRWSGILWIGLGVLQCLTLYGLIAGIWNIIAGIGRLKLATRMGERDSTVPAAFAGIAALVVIGIINVVLGGGVVGVVLVGFDVFVREKVLRHRALFDRTVVAVDAYARKKERREARLRAKGLIG